ncbi:hypothetical protein L6452_28779 [Arctium lappa]|uniref:Uncharacterized protein n=1 Tax=Arctium lappa TaxID=4217 RepID=A0ACB8ZZD7_ARCLA|nr:hypothetical protein L6452_28779 [Arctium lappa]
MRSSSPEEAETQETDGDKRPTSGDEVASLEEEEQRTRKPSVREMLADQLNLYTRRIDELPQPQKSNRRSPEIRFRTRVLDLDLIFDSSG